MRTLFLFRLALFVVILCWIWHENNSLNVTDDEENNSALSFKKDAGSIAELLTRKCCASQQTVQLDKGKFKDY